MAEALTLYKLIILYMLRKVNFPLTNAQISDFILGQEYTSYFHLQQAISEMLEADLVTAEVIRNTSYYRMTEEGKKTTRLRSRNTRFAVRYVKVPVR